MTDFLENLKDRNPHEEEFLQAVEEFYISAKLVLDKREDFRRMRIMERFSEPERVIIFNVPWMDDDGNIKLNRGFRVQMNSALGPYKGGLRFHPSVNLSILKFLAFEQISKNALTTLPLGAGKGGSDFNPKGKSEMEIMRFCQSFMNELFRHIGNETDIPAGDIGVGSREIGYLFGKYKKIRNKFTGVLTGKGINWGGSLIRPEATGYGVVYFAQNMLSRKNKEIAGMDCLVSGAGNVAQYCIEKLLQFDAKVLTASDSRGYIYDEEGFTKEKLEKMMHIKNEQRGTLEEYADQYSGIEYYEHDKEKDHEPMWDIKSNCAFPCATQNEINAKDAQNLVDNGVSLISEGANMPSTNEAIKIFQDQKILYAPGKASNAGGVAVSGLEMTQNSLRMGWSRKEVDVRLRDIMKDIHDTCLNYAEKYGQKDNYLAGANIAGFTKVGDAMIDQGVV